MRQMYKKNGNHHGGCCGGFRAYDVQGRTIVVLTDKWYMAIPV